MMLDVGDGHSIYYEEHGKGAPVIVIHGGPGGGIQRSVLKLFDLRKWHVILYDQRGAGKSTPSLETRANTTWHLVADLERIRTHLSIPRWTLFGGSWGSTLALAYTSKHMDRVAGLILRGICLMEAWENRWLYEPGGVSRIAPGPWRAFTRAAGKHQRHSLLNRYSALLRNRRTRKAAVNAWTTYEHSLSFLKPCPIDESKSDKSRGKSKSNASLAILETHYFRHGAWLRPGQLLRAARRIPASIPVSIVQGRYDLVCPPASAFALHDAIPHSRLILTQAGHSAAEPETAAALRTILAEEKV